MYDCCDDRSDIQGGEDEAKACGHEHDLCDTVREPSLPGKVKVIYPISLVENGHEHEGRDRRREEYDEDS